MPHCSQCGAEVSASDAFCQECGESLDADSGHDHSEESSNTEQPQDNRNSSLNKDNRRTEQGQTQGQSTMPLSGLAPTRLGTIAGAVLVGVSPFLTWVRSIEGSFSWSGMALEVLGPAIIAGAVITFIAGAVTWGDGWGRLSMPITLLAGAGVVLITLAQESLISETYRLSTISLNGREVPAAAVEAGFGVNVALVGGGAIFILSLIGFISSFINN